METFGKEYFKYCVKFDFDRHPELKSVFQVSKDPQRLIKELTLYCDQPIIAGETLMIFDEIQECEEALNSLKYFREEAPQYHIIAAGSLLGVAVKKRKMTVPVGNVKIIDMFPVTFREFLRASDVRTYEYVDSLDEIRHLPEIIMNKLRTEYRRYQVSGGMPEAIVALLEDKGIGEVESALQDILDLYELDFAKYAEPREIPRIHAIWHSLPAQLSKENRKFIYKVIKTGARSKDYEDALMWLEDAGMIYRIFSISKPGMPLSAYEACSAVWLTCLQPLSQTPSPTIRSSREQWPKMPFCSPSCPLWIIRSLIIGRHQEQQKWSSSYNGMMRLSLWRSKLKRISAAAASLSISRHIPLAIACVSLC
jgi:hypothetical protein